MIATLDRPTLRLREWATGWLPGAEMTAADRELASALSGAEARLIVEELREGVRVTSRSWIGVVRFEAFEVTVVPKVAGGNLGVLRMLEFASGIRALDRIGSDRTVEVALAGRLPDLFGLLLAEATSRVVRDGLLADYVTREETLSTLRGRLRVDEQVRRRFLQVDRLECRFDEHETDIPENQLLAAALGVARRVCVDEGVRRQVGRQHAIITEACDASAFDLASAEQSLVYHRRNDRYRTAHELGKLFLRAFALNDLYAPGSRGSFAFLLDMNLLFEQFVTRLLDAALTGSGVAVRAQYRDRTIILEEPLLRPYAGIVPDILLESTDELGRRRVPVDAKYKLYDETKIDPADVYQTFFYAYAYARGEDRDRDLVCAYILYPATGGKGGTRLLVRQDSGATSARIVAVPVDIDGALLAIAERRRPPLPFSASWLPAATASD